MDYDIGIIGGGPAGYHAALEAASNGLNTAIFEKRALGGVCLYEGCIPTKSLVHSTKTFFHVKNDPTISAKELSFNWNEAKLKKEKDVEKLAAGLFNQLNRKGIKIIIGDAALVSSDANGVTICSNNTEYRVKNAIIATGSCNVTPEIKGLAELIQSGLALDSTAILEHCEPIDKLAIIGAGVIGLEMASIYANTGTKVSIFEKKQDILSGLDDDTAKEFIRSLKRKGVQIFTGQSISEVGNDANGIYVYSENPDNDTERYDKLLIAVGRKGCIANLGLDKIPSIKIENGFIATDIAHKTGDKHIYACGDVCGKENLAYTGGSAGETIIRNIVDDESETVNDIFPTVIFTNPEAAFIGKTAKECQISTTEYKEVSCSMNYSSLFAVENTKENGMFKLIVDEKGLIIGCQIIGNGACELIGTVQAFIAGGLSIYDIMKLSIIHPSKTEIIKEAIKQLV